MSDYVVFLLLKFNVDVGMGMVWSVMDEVAVQFLK